MSICIMCIKGSINKENKTMEVAGVRGMSAPLIGTRGNCLLLCQVVVIIIGTQEGKNWGLSRTLHTKGTAGM